MHVFRGSQHLIFNSAFCPACTKRGGIGGGRYPGFCEPPRYLPLPLLWWGLFVRDYAKVSPSFWTRGSGKKIKKDKNACILGLYFVSSPASNSLGLYYLPFSTIMHETPLSLDEVEAALVVLKDAGFAYFDRDHDLVWVPNMAAIDLGDGKELGDRRRKGVENELARIGNHEFVGEFSKKYASAYKLRIPYQAVVSECRIPLPEIKRESDTPQNQEQEQEQEHIQRQGVGNFKTKVRDPVLVNMFIATFNQGAELRQSSPAITQGLDPHQAGRIVERCRAAGVRHEDLLLEWFRPTARPTYALEALEKLTPEIIARCRQKIHLEVAQ